MILTTIKVHVILPFVILTFLLLQIIRCIVRLAAKLIRPDLLSMLDPGDSIFTTDEIHTRSGNTVVTTMVLREDEGPPDAHHIRGVIRVKLLDARDPQNNQLLYPELQCNIENWMGFPFLIPCSVLDGGVRLHGDGEEALAEMELESLQAALTFQPFPVNGPLWEFVLVPKVAWQNGGHSSVIICRIHHSLTDGYGVLTLFQELLDQDSPQIFPMCVQPAEYGPRNLFRYLEGPYDFAKYLYTSSVTTGHFLSQNVEDKIDAKTDHNCPTKCADSLRFAHCETPYGRITQIGRKHGVSGTAVLHSAISGAIATTLFHGGAAASTPGTFLIKTMLPLPWSRRKLLGNHVSTAFYSVDIFEGDVAKRVSLIDQELTALKTSTFPGVMGCVVQFIGSLPAFCQNAFLGAVSSSDNVIQITSVPGPAAGIRFCGYAVKGMSAIAGWVLGLNGPWIVFMTTGELLNVGVLGSRDVVRNGEEKSIVQEFIRELDALEKADKHALNPWGDDHP